MGGIKSTEEIQGKTLCTFGAANIYTETIVRSDLAAIQTHTYKIRFLQFFALLFSLLISLRCFSGEHVLINQFKNLTDQCETKEIGHWIIDLNKFETKLYELSYGMDRKTFRQTFLSHANESINDTLYWIYRLYGHPYATNSTGQYCYMHFYEFKRVLEKTNVKGADRHIDAWKSCVWDIERKIQRMAERLLICYKQIPISPGDK
ncbi:hypothetical protein A9Q99_00555 [Gammaproteobacteria bacterium 45_16_T64]|nr:hypothetical protein A9Q99_00555 [Gammaproteobacteria bacterium 45_16_T64]